MTNRPENSSRQNVDRNVSDRTLMIKIVDDSFETERPTDGHQEVYSATTVRSIPMDVNSRMLAEKSPFFQKMFSNGMRESNARVSTLMIEAHEEAAFMDLMGFMKSNSLPKRNTLELLRLLILADKYEVSSCIDSVLSMLPSPMDMGLALFLSDLPEFERCEPINRIAMEFFTKTLKTLDEFPADIGEVNEVVIKTVLSRNDLSMDTEDVAYDFLMKWVTTHFSDLEGKREFLHANVCKLIRFPNLSSDKRTEFDECPFVEDELRAKVKSEKSRAYRLYKCLNVMVEKPTRDDKGYKVFLELTKEECTNLAQVKIQHSSTFKVAGQEFYLELECKYKEVKEESKPSAFGMRLHKKSVQRVTVISVDVAYEEQRNPERKFAEPPLFQGNTVLNRRKTSIGLNQLDWDRLMATDSKFFIDGSMVIRAILHVK